MPSSLLDRLMDNAPALSVQGTFQRMGQDELPETLPGLKLLVSM